MAEAPDLLTEAKAVLTGNDQGSYTVPAHGLYPHQWLWDSCFIAIGQRHYDVTRAQNEILHLLSGQWSNGMIPHMILSSEGRGARDGHIWKSWLNPYAPDNIPTSGITQPPIVAEAVYRIGQKLHKTERRSWYNTCLPALLAHHQWLYDERDPHSEGLTLQIHPWETGLDNSPPWMQEIAEHQMPLWIRMAAAIRLDKLIGLFRRDTKFVTSEQRESTVEAMVLYSTQRRLRRKAYDFDRILPHSLFIIEDLAFNCILIRNNQLLLQMAKTAGIRIPSELMKRFKQTEDALENLWDPYTSQYYSRNFVTHKLIKEPTVATLLPLYAGVVPADRAKKLVKLLENQHLYGPAFPVPSVPVNSTWFKPMSYWQGPTWINMNWLIIDGLNRYKFTEHADALAEVSLGLIRDGGCSEYFNPITGEPAGAANFSWTAALAIDLLKR